MTATPRGTSTDVRAHARPRLLRTTALVVVAVLGLAFGVVPGADAGEDGIVRVGVIGDYGTGGEDERSVAELVRTFDAEAIVTTGDNRYTGTDIDGAVGQFYADWIGDYVGAYGNGSPTNRFFPSLGNHDYNEDGGLDVHLDYFTLPGAGAVSSMTSGNERYYDVVVGPIHFFLLNSNKQDPDGTSSTSAQAKWLRAQAMASTAPWQVAVFHHPPYSSGFHGPTQRMRWPYADWGVDLVLSGHDHDYERIMKGSLPYLVVGTGGRNLHPAGDRADPDSAWFEDSLHGAVLLEACDAALVASFHSTTAGVRDVHALGAGSCEGGNRPPTVQAGPDLTVELSQSAFLDATVADDGLPTPPNLATTWSTVSGPGEAAFDDRTAVDTGVQFPTVGHWVLQLEADDGELQTTDTVAVTVRDGSVAVEERIDRRPDDAEEDPTGRTRRGRAELTLGERRGQAQVVGLRFTGLQVPQGATITHAWVQFTADQADGGDASFEIRAEATDDAAPIRRRPHDLAGRATTAASVTWQPPTWLQSHGAGPAQRTSDIAAVVQEVVDRGGWQHGNDLLVLFSGEGTRTAVSYNGHPASAPVLHVAFDPG